MKITQIIHATVLVAVASALPKTIPSGPQDTIQKRQGGDCDRTCSGHAYAVAVESTWIIPWEMSAPAPMSETLGVIGSHTFSQIEAYQGDVDGGPHGVCGAFSKGWSTTCNGDGVPTGFSGPEGSGVCTAAKGDCVYEGGLSTLTYTIAACCDLS